MGAQHSVAAHYEGGFDVDALEKWAAELRTRFPADEVSLGLIFISPQFFEHAKELLEILRVHARIPLLLGCSSGSLIIKEREIEKGACLALALYYLPEAELKAVRLTQAQLEQAEHETFWPTETGVEETNGWLVFADPFHLNPEQWLQQWNAAWPVAIIVCNVPRFISMAMSMKREVWP